MASTEEWSVMPNEFDDLIAEMEDNGVDPAFIERTKAAAAKHEASPLRAELKTAKAEAQTAIARAQKAEATVLGSTFKELGIPGRPSALALPADLDITDRNAIQSWAVENELIAPPEPNVPTADLDALDRVQQAATGAGSSNVDPTAALAAARSSDEFWANAEAAGVVDHS